MTHAFSLRCGTAADSDRPRVLAPPPFLYLPALGAGFALQALLAEVAAPDRPVRVLGYALLLAGGALAAAFVRSFLRARTSIDFGRATALVTTGPYRVSRNPGYVGMALVYAGIAVAAGAWLAFATLVPALVAIDRCVIRGEEAHLAARFGAEYDAYRRRTRRWL